MRVCQPGCDILYRCGCENERITLLERGVNSSRKVCAPDLFEKAALFEILGVRVIDDLLSFLAHVAALLARILDNSRDSTCRNYQLASYQPLCVGVIRR